jgi:hypothetical protein
MTLIFIVLGESMKPIKFLYEEAMRRFESFKAGWLQAEQRMKEKNKEKMDDKDS